MRRSVMTILTAAALSSALSGCFPLIVGGMASSAMVASDRRTSGAYVDDQAIQLKGAAQLSSKFPKAHININSFNRAVLMTGEVASDEERTSAEMVVRGLPGVKRVENYMVVAEPTTFGQRNNDTWITTKVRSRLVGGKGNYSSQAIKLVSERGVVYMMGLVTRDEGDAVAKVASETDGVQKVVTLFEYLHAVPALPTAASAAQ